MASNKSQIQALQERFNRLEKKVLVIIVVVIVLSVNQGYGAVAGILIGFSTLEVNSMISPIIWFALVAGLGSAFRAFLGYLSKKGKGVKFDYQMLLISFLPAVVAGLGSSFYLTLQLNLTNIILVFFGAAGLNSLQDKFGLQKKK